MLYWAWGPVDVVRLHITMNVVTERGKKKISFFIYYLLVK